MKLVLLCVIVLGFIHAGSGVKGIIDLQKRLACRRMQINSVQNPVGGSSHVPHVVESGNPGILIAGFFRP